MIVILVLLSATAYLSHIWGALFFFRVQDPGAAGGKRLISIVGGGATIIGIWAATLGPSEYGKPYIAAIFWTLSAGLFWWTLSMHNEPLDFVFSNAEPGSLVTSGPYARIRHPFYTSYVLGWIAPLVLRPGILTVAVFVAMLFLYIVAARKEEQLFLKSRLATEYALYVKRTGKFSPWV